MTENKQTIASKKYQDKVGIIAKSYKLKKDLVEEFAQACSQAGISQAAQITKMMKEFIENVNKNESGNKLNDKM